MSDRLRQAFAFAIAIGMVIAVAAAPTIAQQQDPDAERVFEPAGINADKVDGKHAVAYTAKKGVRAKKLVATNSIGMLPPNIVRPKWSLIQGKPAVLADGKVGWGEVANKPAGFADGVDNAGVTGVKLTFVETSVTVPAGGTAAPTAWCPSGAKVTGGGFYVSAWGWEATRNQPYDTLVGWAAGGRNTGGGSLDLKVFAICMSTTPTRALTTATR